MKEPYCGNCGVKFIDIGLVEHVVSDSYTVVALNPDGGKFHVETETDFDSEVFVSVDCGKCGHPLNESQTKEYHDMGNY